MRPAQLHRRNSAFARSSSLGEIHAAPVIREVSIARGRGSPRTIVKDGLITTNSFEFPIYSSITFNARLIGAGYFYATFDFEGTQHLLFVTPAQPKLSYSLDIEKKLRGLNFHISPAIPTQYSPLYLDSKSKELLRTNPSSFNQLGFMPKEPSLTVENDDYWNGKLNDHSWKYGRSGTAITKDQKVKWRANYDASWLGASGVYKYVQGSGWECVQQNTAFLQVGQPHCIVGQLVGYVNTYGLGGEYHPYTDSGDFPWGSAESIRGDRIRLMNHGFRNYYGQDNSDYFNKNRFKIQAYDNYINGGKVPLNFKGSYHFPVSEESDKFCAKVEWWNPDTNEWSKPAIHPTWTSKIDGTGSFAFYFRFPRQLTLEDEFYDKTPQWRIGETWDSYPQRDSDSNSPTFNDVIYRRIGRPKRAGSSENLQLEFEGQTMRTAQVSPNYCIMIAPEAKRDQGKGGGDKQKNGYIPVSGDIVYSAVDPYAYSYADNPDIMKAYWKGGSFKPGGTFMILGKALDMFPGLWVSTKSLKTKGSTPMDLQNQQYEFIRGDYNANQFTADKIPQARSLKAVDVDIPSKVSAFQPYWDKCFPGVPLTKSVLTALIRGDSLPELEGIEYSLIPGFLEDDPLRYETTYEGQKYRHSYTLSLCTIPEGWWGPTVEIQQIGEGATASFESTGPDSVYFGGANMYYYIKEESVNLATEIEIQMALKAQGLTAAETFAASELENPMVDITFEAYKNRNETVAEAVNEEPQDEKSWLFRTDKVLLRHRKFSLLGGTSVTDVTNRYSADHSTSLDGITSKNVKQYGFDELYVMDGINGSPSIVTMPPLEPSGKVPIKHSNVADFGNSSRAALKARALGNGNPMKYSTEEKQDNMQIQQMGGVLDDAIGLAPDTIKNTVTGGAMVLGAGLLLAGALKISPILNNMRRAKSAREEQEFRTASEQISFQDKLSNKKK